MLDEPIPQGASRVGGGSPFTVHIYGMTTWRSMFTPRQLASLAVLARASRSAFQLSSSSGYDEEWREAMPYRLRLVNLAM